METCLRHYPDQYDAEEKANQFARLRPNVDGFITFKILFGGRRFFWVTNGKAEEIEPMECFMRTQAKRKGPNSYFKKRIQNILFGEKTSDHEHLNP